MSESETGVNTAIPVRRSTREEVVKPLKRGGETYDSLLRRLAESHDPEDV